MTFENAATEGLMQTDTLPYRWGYFQGVMLIPWSLVIILFSFPFSANYWYVSLIVLLMGFVGLPLAYCLLTRKALALKLVYVMFGLSLLLALIQTPIAIMHYAERGEQSSAFSPAILLMIWLCSLLYYRRRIPQFR